MVAGELVTTVDGATISFNLNPVRHDVVAKLTTPELTIEAGAVRDTSGNPIDGSFDLSTASFANVTFSVSSPDSPQGMAFSNDGTRMFVVDSNNGKINEYALSTPFDVSTAAFVDAFSVSPQETSPTGMAFSNDGAMMFVIGGAGGINEYALLAPFDLSTASFANAAFPASSLDSPQGMAFSNDGTTMFVVDSSTGRHKRIHAARPLWNLHCRIHQCHIFSLIPGDLSNRHGIFQRRRQDVRNRWCRGHKRIRAVGPL